MTAKIEIIRLADDRELTVRKPTVSEDKERLIAFFSGLPRGLRNYLRYNVTNPDLCQRRLELVDGKDHWRLIAELDGDIMGEGSMDREPFGWTHHIAHLRIVVEPTAVRLGIGTILLRRLVELGRSAGIERFYSEVIKEHTEMISALEQEGFVYEATRKDYAKDLKGKLHDVVIMSNDQSAVWSKLEEHIEEMDIRMPAIHRGA